MGKGQANTRAHTANNGGIQSEILQAREDEAGEGGRSHRSLSATQKTLNFIPVCGVVVGCHRKMLSSQGQRRPAQA